MTPTCRKTDTKRSSGSNRNELGSIIRRLSRDEDVSAKTDSISAKPDQARLHDPAAQEQQVIARVFIGGAVQFLGVLVEFTLNTLSSYPFLRSCFSPFKMVHDTTMGQSNSIVFVCAQPRPSLISFYRDHIGFVSTESNSASGRDKSSTDPLYAFDPEIELTLRRLRKIRNTIVNTSSSSDSAINSNLSSANTLVSSSNIFAESRQMENNDRTLKELATPDVVYQPWCIQYPQLEPAQTYELKSGLIHLLPKFYGLAGEDSHKHLKEFHVVCSTMRPQGISEYYIKMKAFPFSLDGAATDWLYLQPVLFNTWGDMKLTFLE
ncbi:hypothetical protein CR513_36274, partial [Mucuna pruriens]